MQVKGAPAIPQIVTAKLKHYNDIVTKDPDSGKYCHFDRKRKASACDLEAQPNPEFTAGS